MSEPRIRVLPTAGLGIRQLLGRLGIIVQAMREVDDAGAMKSDDPVERKSADRIWIVGGEQQQAIENLILSSQPTDVFEIVGQLNLVASELEAAMQSKKDDPAVDRAIGALNVAIVALASLSDVDAYAITCGGWYGRWSEDGIPGLQFKRPDPARLLIDDALDPMVEAKATWRAGRNRIESGAVGRDMTDDEADQLGNLDAAAANAEAPRSLAGIVAAADLLLDMQRCLDPIERTLVGRVRDGAAAMMRGQPEPEIVRVTKKRDAAKKAARSARKKVA